VNDTEREQWVDNDEGLYLAWRSSSQPKRRFIREHRGQIDAVIDNVVSGRRRPHYLAHEKETVRTFTIRSSDIERCPRRSLSPSHYQEDGTCRCPERQEET